MKRPLTNCPQDQVAQSLSPPSVYGCSQKKVPLPGQLSVPPTFAWPTLLLAAVGLGWYAATHARYYSGDVPYLSALLQWTVSAYLCFTPTHDAVHDAVASSRAGKRLGRAINSITGRLCALPLCAPFYAFRYLHLQHHKYTNVVGKDPDLWSSLSPSLHRFLERCASAGFIPSACAQLVVVGVMLLKWITQTFAYLAHYWRHRSERPRDEVCETFVMAAVQVLYPLVSLVLHGAQSWAFWCYALPGYLSICFLACTFDYIPHRPHGTTDIYRGTSVTALYATKPTKAGSAPYYITSPLTWPMLYQNYHIVHHLYPWVPFYRYSAVWKEMETQLVSEGVPIVPLLPLAIPSLSV